jgi:hypothetical protein
LEKINYKIRNMREREIRVYPKEKREKSLLKPYEREK